jgi:hypothetical protein
MTRVRRLSREQYEEMVEEATVDCYNDSEKITGWFTMIEENLSVPFEVDVLGAPAVAERIDLTTDERIVAICARGPHRQSIPLLDLPHPRSLPRGWEWVEAYRLWELKTGTSQFREE